MYAASHAAAGAATKIPAMCTNWTMSRTPAQLSYCVKLGWHEPTNAAVNAGHASTSGAGIALAVVVIVLVLIAMTRRSGRSPAPQRS